MAHLLQILKGGFQSWISKAFQVMTMRASMILSTLYLVANGPLKNHRALLPSRAFLQGSQSISNEIGLDI
jgi:hypothetical protein